MVNITVAIEYEVETGISISINQKRPGPILKVKFAVVNLSTVNISEKVTDRASN